MINPTLLRSSKHYQDDQIERLAKLCVSSVDVNVMSPSGILMYTYLYVMLMLKEDIVINIVN